MLVEAGGDVQEADRHGPVRRRPGPRRRGARRVPSELPDKMAWTTRQPVGVVGMITPWNFPVAIPSWKFFPALLAGNGIVLKPSEHAPLCADAFVGVPGRGRRPGRPGATSCTATASPARRSPCTPASARVSFTGSVPTGRLVAAAAMETGPRLVSLELGGKNAMVVLADADLDLVVDGALFGAFGTAGQRCTSTSRLVVHRAVADELVDAHRRRGPRRSCSATRRRPGDRRRSRHRRRGRRRASSAMVDDARSARAPTVVTGGHVVDGRRLRGRRVRRADDPARRAAATTDRPRGGVRSGARRDRGRRPRRGRRRRQRHPSTGCRPRSTRATSTPRCGPSTASTPASST